MTKDMTTRLPHEAGAKLRNPPDVRQLVPAVLLHGGHHHRGALPGHRAPGGGGLHRLYQLLDSGLLHRHLRRVHHPVSQSYGAKDFQDLKRFVGNILWLASGFTLVITVLTVALCRPILQWMDTPADILDDAYSYIVVIFLGIPTIVLYNVLASLLRALGDSRTPVIFLVVASLLNIALDLFLIVVIPMGVAGAAWATVISQGISGLACLVFIWKKFPLLHVSRDDLVFRKDYARRLLGMGIPMGLQSSITAIGSILLQTSVNGLGSVVVASITAANKLYQLFSCVFDALGVAMSTYGGQNIGARRGDRIFAGLRAGMIIGSVYSPVLPWWWWFSSASP